MRSSQRSEKERVRNYSSQNSIMAFCRASTLA
jgi:hypothetical protein